MTKIYSPEELNRFSRETLVAVILSMQDQLARLNTVKIAVLAHTARSTRATLPKQESHLAGWLN